MEASTVYYTDFRCPVGTSLTEKLRRLCIAAGIKNIDMEGKVIHTSNGRKPTGEWPFHLQSGLSAPQLC